MRIFHLASDLGPTATGRRVSLLVPELAARGLIQCVGVLDSKKPHFPREALSLPVRPWFDIAGWLRLRRAVAEFQPAIVHAWGRRAAEMLHLVRAPRLLKTLDEPESYLSRRVGQRVVVPPMVAPFSGDRDAARQALGLSVSARAIVAADRFETGEAMKFAIGAFDVLKYTSSEWRLLLLGDGPRRAEVERYAVKLGADDNRVRFLGVRDARLVLAAADAAWQPRRSGGAHFSLEVLAAGVPLIARPEAADAIAFAAKTNALLTAEASPIVADRETALRFSAAAAAEVLLLRVYCTI